MYFRTFREFVRSFRFHSRRSSVRIRSARCVPTLYRLESRDVPAPLTWAAGVGLPVAEGGIVGLIDPLGGTIPTVVGGPTTAAYHLTVADPTWKATVNETVQPLDFARSSPGVGSLPNGYLLVFGGSQAGTATDGVTQFDPNGANETHGGAGNFTQTLAAMISTRALLGSATDLNFTSYAVGGIDDAGTPLASMEAYDPRADTWSNLAALPQTLFSESVVGDRAGHLFTFGGVGADGAITQNVYRYTIATNIWDRVASMPLGVRDSAAVLGPNGSIYILGGKTSTGTTAAVESYNLTTNTWTTEAPLPSPVSSEAAVVDYLGRIEVIGGIDASNRATAAVSISQQLNRADVAPTITSSPISSVVVNLNYAYQVLSTANPQATYTLVSAPVGMTIDAKTGLIAYAPNYAGEGIHTITIRADNFAGQTTQTFSLKVVPPAVTGLKAVGATTTSINLSWTASNDPNVTSYKVFERTFLHNPRGSGGRYIYSLVASSITATAYKVGGLKTSTAGGGSHTYVVVAVDFAGLDSSYSAIASSQTLFAPTLWGATTLSGAVVSSVAVARGHSVQINLLAYGNEAPKFSIVAGPTTVSVDATTGLVTYAPGPAEFGNVIVTFQAKNSIGTSTYAFTFVVS